MITGHGQELYFKSENDLKQNNFFGFVKGTFDDGTLIKGEVYNAFEIDYSDHKFVKRIGANLLGIKISEYTEKAKNQDYITRKLETVGNGFTPPGSLFIKQFPTSQATVLDIEAYLSQIEEEKGKYYYL
mgnify:CR=1 FL=1